MLLKLVNQSESWQQGKFVYKHILKWRPRMAKTVGRQKNHSELQHQKKRFSIIHFVSSGSSRLDGLVLLSHGTTFLFLKLNVPQCAGKESIRGQIRRSWVALHFICNQFDQALDWSNGDLWVSLLKEVEISADKMKGNTNLHKGQEMTRKLAWIENKIFTCSVSRQRVSRNPCYPGPHLTFAVQH